MCPFDGDIAGFSGQIIAVNIKPASRLAHEAAALVQAHRTARLPAAGDKFDFGVVLVEHAVGAHFQLQLFGAGCQMACARQAHIGRRFGARHFLVDENTVFKPGHQPDLYQLHFNL